MSDTQAEVSDRYWRHGTGTWQRMELDIDLELQLFSKYFLSLYTLLQELLDYRSTKVSRIDTGTPLEAYNLANSYNTMW